MIEGGEHGRHQESERYLGKRNAFSFPRFIHLPTACAGSSHCEGSLASARVNLGFLPLLLLRILRD